jgi:hypothetical protein
VVARGGEQLGDGNAGAATYIQNVGFGLQESDGVVDAGDFVGVVGVLVEWIMLAFGSSVNRSESLGTAYSPLVVDVERIECFEAGLCSGG